MKSIIHHLTVQTHLETEMIDITSQVKSLVRESGVLSGFVLCAQPAHHYRSDREMRACRILRRILWR